MKTIQQLLELSKNPFYTFLPEEKEVLDAFLSQKREKATPNSQKKSSKQSDSQTPVTVRNVVPKVDTSLPDAPEAPLSRL